MAITLSPLLLLLLPLLLPICFFGFYSSITSTLLLLALPTSFPFIFSKLNRLLAGSHSMEASLPKEKEKEEEEEEEELVLTTGECSPSERHDPNSEETVCCDRGDFVSDDETSTEGDADSLASISDDESLIEITLKEEPPYTCLPQRSTSDDSFFMKHGLMELFGEINEEDNMIEIDIAMGSIKCSRLEIKA